MSRNIDVSRAMREALAAQLIDFAQLLLTEPLTSDRSTEARDSCGDRIFDFDDQGWMHSFRLPLRAQAGGETI